MSYETAPATRMLATHCCACGKELLDAKSVEAGMGPDCRRKYYNKLVDHLTEEQRRAANKLVYDIALDQGRTVETLLCASKLRDLGFDKLADRVVKGNAKVQIELVREGWLAVRAPFKAEAVTAWHDVQGQKWDPATKRRLVPTLSKVHLYMLLSTHYAGLLGVGPLGPFVVGEKRAPQT